MRSLPYNKIKKASSWREFQNLAICTGFANAAVEGNCFGCEKYSGFRPAYKGIIADGAEQVLEESKKHFGDVDVFRQLFEAKKNKACNSELLTRSYEAIEQVYQRILQHG